MALLDTIRGLGKKASQNLERNIGGLLGEDISKLSEEERRAIRQQALAAVFDAMARGTTPSAGLRQVAADTAARREAAQTQQRQQAAEAMLPDISSRILGGRTGTMIEDVQGGPATPLTARRMPSAEGARTALGMMYGTQAGRDVATMAPDLATLAREGVTGRTVGGSVYNPLTGDFTRPPTPMAPAPSRAPTAAPAAGRVAPAAPAATRYRVMTPSEVQAANLPEGTSAQLDTQTGQVKILSAVPAAQRAGQAGKSTAVTRVDDLANKIDSQMNKVRTGGPLGIVGALSQVFDSQDAKLFKSYQQQLSSALRTALRIPGEGALSDFEQKQYGLQLPELGQSSENNRQILISLQNQVRLAAGMPPLESAPEAGGVDYIYKDGKLIPARKR
jgi:hypothetical protein